MRRFGIVTAVLLVTAGPVGAQMTNSVDLGSARRPAEQKLKPPSAYMPQGQAAPQNNNAEPWIRLGAGLLDQAIRQGQQQQQQQQQQQFRPQTTYPQNQYSPPTVYRPLATESAVGNDPVAGNVLPSFDQKPEANQMATLQPATAQQLEKASEALDSQLRKDADKLKKDQALVIEEKLSDLLTPGPGEQPLSVDEELELRQAILQKSVPDIERITKGMNPVKATQLIHQVKLAKGIDTLAESISAGAPAKQVDAISKALAKQINATNQPGLASTQPLQQLDSLVKLANGRDVLLAAVNNPNASVTSLPPGTMPMVSVSEWPQGTVSVIPGGPVVVGTGGVGVTGFTEGDTSEVLGIATPAGDPLPEDSGKTYSGIVIRSSKETPSEVNYTINGYAFALKPGYTQQLDENSSWVIEYDRGGSFGTQRQTLESGTHEFSVNPDGWKLSKKTYAATIDNSKNRNPFHYQLNGKPESVAARATATHKSDYTMLLVFDSGDGGEPAKKKLADGTYQVGLDMAKRRIELYPKASLASTNVPAKSLSFFPTAPTN